MSTICIGQDAMAAGDDAVLHRRRVRRANPFSAELIIDSDSVAVRRKCR